VPRGDASSGGVRWSGQRGQERTDQRRRAEIGRGSCGEYAGSVVVGVVNGVEALAGVLRVDPFLDEVGVGEVGQGRPDAPL